MKDLPHHIKKLNRRMIRSVRRDMLEEELPEIPTYEETKRQARKKEKIRMRQEREEHVPIKKNIDERNQEMKKGRTPVFDRNTALPKSTKPTRKKTPRI